MAAAPLPRGKKGLRGVSNGTRTRDHLDHNQVLYQLSYTHHVLRARQGWISLAARPGRAEISRPTDRAARGRAASAQFAVGAGRSPASEPW